MVAASPQVFYKAAFYLPTPFPGVGGERSETEGGGWMGRSAARVQRVAVAASPQFL